MRKAERISATDWWKAVLEAKTEDMVDVEVEDVLKRHGVSYGKTRAERSFNANNQIVKRLPDGWPDFTACLPPMGRFFVIEAKRPVGGKLRYDQAVRLSEFWEGGALICIARSGEDVEDVIKNGNRQRDIDEVKARLAQGLLASDLPRANQLKRRK